ncbi:MAG: CPBP family intramembrane metalloprotease [Dehalococcoidia bacterium]|nr:CPBP family intramembrane metalloprotease [Dehalococcoidia bacterium]
MSDTTANLPPSVLESADSQKLWGPWATIGLGAVIMLLWMVAQTMVVVGFLLVKLYDGIPADDLVVYIQSLASNGLLLALSSSVSAVVGIAAIYLFVRIRGNRSPVAYLGLNPVSPRTVLLTLGVFVLLLVAIMILDALVFQADPSAGSGNDNFMIDAYRTAGWLPFLWVAVAGLGPAFEEFFFRGFLFAGLKRSRLGLTGTIIFTSLVWAALHIQYDWLGMLQILLMGLVLGLLRWHTRSLLSPLLFHSAWNLLALASVSLVVNG